MEAQMKWKVGDEFATFFGKQIKVSNKVRNFKNGTRGLENPEEVIHTMPIGDEKPVPYMPCGFPAGKWVVGKPVEKTNPYLAPYFIPTDAWQYVEQWDTDADGSYKKASGKMVKDCGYGIHTSTSSTTLGCLKVIDKSDLLWLVQQIKSSTETIYFEVTA